MKRHELDPFSLAFGAVFALLGVVFLAARPDVRTLHLQWVWPIPILALGLLIVVLAARPSGRGTAAPEEMRPDDEAEASSG
jgi:hypothetical protein